MRWLRRRVARDLKTWWCASFVVVLLIGDDDGASPTHEASRYPHTRFVRTLSTGRRLARRTAFTLR